MLGFKPLIKSIFKHSVAKNTTALLTLQIANYTVPLIVLLYLANVLGVEIYGVVAFSVGVVQLSGVLTDFGFGLSASHKISVRRESKNFVSRLIGAIFVIKLALLAVVALGISAFAFSTDKYSEYSLLFFLSIIPVIGYAFQPTWFFVGIERMFYITTFSVIAKTLYVVSIVLLISDKTDYLWIPIANGAAQIVATVTAIICIYRSGYYLSIPKRREIFYAIKMTRGVFLSRLSVAAYMRSAVLLLGVFATPAAVAIYSLAEQLYIALQSTFSSIVLAVYPYMAKEKDFPLFYKIIGGCTCAAVFVACFGYYFAPKLVPMMFGEQWVASIPVLNVFFVAIIIHVMAAMSGYPLAAALNRVDVANKTVVCGAIVFLLLASILVVIGLVTPLAFAVIMVVSEFCVLVYRGLTLWAEVYRMRKVELNGNVR